ncbi:MAG: class I SAM-dependent methyltransferase, partial [Actinomycetota bacterium]
AAGLAHVEAEAARRELDIRCLHADANALEPFEGRRFDLVTACYASLPRTTDDRAVHNLIGAVAPGGTLLLVSHDPTPLRAPIDTATASRAFDPDAYVGVEHVVAHIADDPDWTIEVHELRRRPLGSATHSHHVDDVVVRARRTIDPQV